MYSSRHVLSALRRNIVLSARSPAPLHYPSFQQRVSFFSTNPPEAGSSEPQVGTDKTEATPSPVAELEAQLKDKTNQLMRALADAENSRTIAKRDVENARQFAVTRFAKSLLDVADNLAMATSSIAPEELSKPGNETLRTVVEGVTMTETLLAKVFKENGLTQFGEKGEKFDPNKHDALFELADPSLPKGSLGQILKIGYALNGRVVRPAQLQLKFLPTEKAVRPRSDLLRASR